MESREPSGNGNTREQRKQRNDLISVLLFCLCPISRLVVYSWPSCADAMANTTVSCLVVVLRWHNWLPRTESEKCIYFLMQALWNGKLNIVCILISYYPNAFLPSLFFSISWRGAANSRKWCIDSLIESSPLELFFSLPGTGHVIGKFYTHPIIQLSSLISHMQIVLQKSSWEKKREGRRQDWIERNLTVLCNDGFCPLYKYRILMTYQEEGVKRLQS